MANNAATIQRQLSKGCLDRNALLALGQASGSKDCPVEKPCDSSQIPTLLCNALNKFLNQPACTWLLPTSCSRPWLQNGGPVIVKPVTSPGGILTTIVDIKIDEGFTGVIDHLGVDAEPQAELVNIRWQLQISGENYAKFSNVSFFLPSLQTPYHFPMMVGPNKRIRLLALNNGANQVSCFGILQGWMEPTVEGQFVG